MAVARKFVNMLNKSGLDLNYIKKNSASIHGIIGVMDPDDLYANDYEKSGEARSASPDSPRRSSSPRSRSGASSHRSGLGGSFRE